MSDNNRTFWIIIGLIAIIAICLVIVLIIGFTYVQSQPVEPITPIDTVVAQTFEAFTATALTGGITATVAPATPSQVPIDTAVPSATSPALPTPTPTLIPTDPPTVLGDPDWIDKFDNVNNWTLFDTDCFESQIDDGKYIMTSKTAPSITCWEVTWPKIQNFYLQTLTETSDECVGGDRFGLFFRGPDTSQGYLFGLTCEGQYGMAKWTGSEWDFFVDFTSNEHILAGPNQLNRIGVFANGDQFGLYINGNLVAQVVDDTFIGEGLFGYFVGAQATEGFTVVYDDLAYWSVP